MTARKRVRVTLDGWAEECPLSDGRSALIHDGPGPVSKLLGSVYDTARDGVTVEWLPEPHDWRAGDAIVWGGLTYVRRARRWESIPDMHGTDFQDRTVDEWVANGAAALRYQADES